MASKLRTPHFFFGSDPGVGGYTCFMSREGEVLALIPHQRKVKGENVWQGDALRAAFWLYSKESLFGLVEKVGGGSFGDRKQGGVGMFNFGMAAGLVLGYIEAYGIDHEMIRPLLWMSKMHSRTGGDKKVSQARVLELLGLKVSQKAADAVLIAECARTSYHQKFKAV